MKPSEAAEIVMLLLAAYPNARTTTATSQVYEQSLEDLDVTVARQAVQRLLSTSKFLPTIAEIRAAATDLRLGPPRTGGEAWADAIAAVRRVGRYGIPEWEDPLLAEAMRLWGSWRDFCNSPEDDPGGRARFIELYEQLAARKRTDVVSGIALPAPKQVPRLESHEKNKPKGAQAEAPRAAVTGARDPQVLAQIVSGIGSNPKRAVSGRAVGTGAGAPPNLNREPRRMTAAEIDAALEAR